jgi:hypothetical protein
MATDNWTFFFSGRNYVKIGFGGNVTTGTKKYSRLAGYVFQRVQITTGKITTGK